MNVPQTEQEMKDYFFSLIGRRIGDSANDFSDILNQEFEWKGRRMKIPHNVPKAGERLSADAPFFGLTRQTDPSGNQSKARIWIPAAEPDIDEHGNRWFTRYFQIVEDTPGGVHGRDFTWSWSYKSGHAYVPLTGPGPVEPPVQPPPVLPPPNTSALEARVKALENELKEIGKLMTEVKAETNNLVQLAAERAVTLILGSVVAKGNTGRSYGHGHSVELPLERKG